MRHLLVPATLTVAIALGGCGGSNSGSALPQRPAATQVTSTPTVSTQSAHRTLRGTLGATSILSMAKANTSQAKLCARPVDSAHAGCFATIRTDSLISSAFPDAVNGLTPTDLSTLYAYPAPSAQGSAGNGQTVAVVVAGDYALAESDLAVYRAHFGLPPCTTANGCLSKVGAAAPSSSSISANPTSISANPTSISANPTSISANPTSISANPTSISANPTSISANPTSISAHPTTPSAIGWAAETDSDTQLISAVCPNCKIIIAEAASDSMTDLGMAAVAAINANASIINTSFGAPESSDDVAWSTAYNSMRHVKLVAAAGDWGYGVYYPASDPGAIAVGGTSLSVSGSTVSETVWSGTSSGCSAYFTRPTWQHLPKVSGACQTRNVVDVAAVADPATGVAIYDSSLFGLTGGWSIFGGTSVAAPIITGMYALSGDTASAANGAQTLYAGWHSFLPVTSGSNGSCAPLYLCTATNAYSGPGGLGIPQGLGGF